MFSLKNGKCSKKTHFTATVRKRIRNKKMQLTYFTNLLKLQYFWNDVRNRSIKHCIYKKDYVDRIS